MRPRRAARERALQILYQTDLAAEGFDPSHPILPEPAEDTEVSEYTDALVSGAIAERDEIDRRIAAAVDHWKLDRVGAVERAILRIGAYEILRRDDIPPKVAINEAVDLAKRFGGKDSGGFVNAVLDRLLRETPDSAPAASEGA